MTRVNILISTSVAALAIVLVANPGAARAGEVCEVNGTSATSGSAPLDDSLACGETSEAGYRGVAIGYGAFAPGWEGLAIGYNSLALEDGSTAVGGDSEAGPTGSAFGYESTATENASAFGAFSVARLEGAALGFRARAQAFRSSAFGSGALATAEDSLALGARSLADQPWTVSVGTVGGERRIVNVAAGVGATDAVNVGQMQAANAALQTQITANSTAIIAVDSRVDDVEAVNAAQQTQIDSHSTTIATVQAVTADHSTRLNTLDSQVAAFGTSLSGMQSEIDALFGLRGEDRRDMKQGVAAAIAIANAPMPSAPGRISYAINGAAYRGEYAAGGSLMYRLPTASPMAINVGISHAGSKNTGVRVGVAGEF